VKKDYSKPKGYALSRRKWEIEFREKGKDKVVKGLPERRDARNLEEESVDDPHEQKEK